MERSSPLFVDDLATLSAITGILIILWLVQGAVAPAVVLGVFALLYGAAPAVLAVSFRLRVP